MNMSDEMKSYYVGFTVRVDCEGEEQTGHRIQVPVTALNAEHAANSFAYALGVVASEKNMKPAKESKAK